MVILSCIFIFSIIVLLMDACQFNLQWWMHAPADQAQCEAKDGEDDLEPDADDVPAKTRYYFCKNGPVCEYHLTEEEREEISSIRAPVQSGNPVFVQVMHPSHVRSNKTGAVVSVVHT